MQQPQLIAVFRVTFIATLGAVTWLALTSEPMPAPLTLWDKGNHFSAFIVLSFLLDYSFPRRHWTALLKWLSLLGYGIGIEFVQRWLGTRDFDVHDMVADAVGISAYLVIRPLLSGIRVLANLRRR